VTCRVGIDKDGNRFIACSRGRHEPIIAQEAGCIVPPSSPWQLGRRVRHKKHGEGIITARNSDAITVQFDAYPNKPPSAFMLAYVGTTMEVL